MDYCCWIESYNSDRFIMCRYLLACVIGLMATTILPYNHLNSQWSYLADSQKTGCSTIGFCNGPVLGNYDVIIEQGTYGLLVKHPSSYKTLIVLNICLSLLSKMTETDP